MRKYLWLIPGILALALSLYQIERISFDLDETATAQWAREADYKHISENLFSHYEGNSWGYPLFIQTLGTQTELGLRLPSALAFVILILSLCYWAQKKKGPFFALGLGTTLALSLRLLASAQNARVFAFVTLVSVIHYMLCTTVIQEEPRKKTWWIGFILSGALLPYLHYYAGFTLVAGFLFFAFTKNLKKNELLAYGLMGILQLPLMPLLMHQMKYGPRWGSFQLSHLPSFFSDIYMDRMTSGLPALILTLVASLVLILKGKRLEKFTVLWTWLPWCIGLSLALLTRPLFEPRYFLFFTVGSILTWHLALEIFASRWIPLRWGHFLFLALSLPFLSQWEARLPQHNFRGAALWVKENLQICSNRITTHPALKYRWPVYLSDTDLKWSEKTPQKPYWYIQAAHDAEFVLNLSMGQETIDTVFFNRDATAFCVR